MTNKEICFYYLTGTAALSRAVAIGIMANIQHESNYNPNAKGDGGTSYGICQWHKSRWDRLNSYCASNDLSASDLTAQLRFLVYEFKKFYTKHWETINAQPNTVDGAAEVAYTMCVKYEIPANKESSGKKRGETARKLWNEFSTTESGKVENPVEDIPSPFYRVQSGDTLTKIAGRVGCSIGDIMAANPKRWNPNLIYVGERLNIPRQKGD